MLDSIVEWIKKWWLVVSGFALAVLYYLYARRGRTIEELHLEAQKQILVGKLQDIRAQAAQGKEAREVAQANYEALKLRHADLLQRLGVTLRSSGGDKPSSE